MSQRYAAKTEVPADKSKAEIERTLVRYGADQFMYGWDANSAIVGFRIQGRMVRLYIPMPDRGDQVFRFTESGRERTSPAAIQEAYELAIRQRWRAVAMIVKAKLEAVAAGISTLESEFLANTLLPDGRTVGAWLEPQIAEAYATGQMPASLPGLPEPPRHPQLPEAR